MPANIFFNSLLERLLMPDSTYISSRSVEPTAVLPRDLWSTVLQETLVEVFSSMVGADVTTTPTDAPLPSVQLTGIVGIAGAIRANFILRCSNAASSRLASQMLGISPDDSEAQKASPDALGEICNIVAGYFKAKVGMGDACKLSVPTIIIGQNYRFHSAKMRQKLEIAVSYEGEHLLATLEIA